MVDFLAALRGVTSTQLSHRLFISLLYCSIETQAVNSLDKYNMALAQAANYVEKLLGHQDNATTEQNASNPAKNRAKYGHPTETMKALCWQGKNTVKVCTFE